MPTPVEWLCYSRARDAGLNETRVRAKAEHPEETKHSLSKTELTTVPGTVGDPLRVLMNMPGMARVPFGLGLLVVRGSSPGDTGVFIGGEPVPVLYHFLAGPSVFTYNLIDKIDFYPGGFGVRYGRYIGGAIDVTIKGDVGRTLHGAVDVNLRDSAAFVEGPLGKGYRASFAVRRSYIDVVLPVVLPLFVEQRIGSTYVSVAPVYWDYQGRVDKDLAGGGRLSLIGYGSSDALEVVAGDPTLELTADSQIGFHHLMGEWVTTLPGGWASRLTAMYAYGEPEHQHRPVRRLPALCPFLRTARVQQTLRALDRADGRPGRRAQLRLGEVHRHPVPARRPHAGADDAAAERDQPGALQHRAGGLRRGAVEPAPEAAPGPRPAVRLLPRARHGQVFVGPAAGGALGRDAVDRDQGVGRHLSPAADARVPGPRVRQPEPEAAASGAVPAGRRAPVHRRDQSDGDGVLRGARGSACAQHRSLLQHRARARLRPR